MPLRDGSAEDYPGASRRHYSNAIDLNDAGQFDNAGHLIGFAAECAIKHAIQLRGEQSARVHLPDLAAAARRSFNGGRRRAPIFNLLKGDVLKGWSVDQRYSPTGYITSTTVLSWIGESRRLMAAAGVRGGK